MYLLYYLLNPRRYIVLCADFTPSGMCQSLFNNNQMAQSVDESGGRGGTTDIIFCTMIEPMTVRRKSTTLPLRPY